MSDATYDGNGRLFKLMHGTWALHFSAARVIETARTPVHVGFRGEADISGGQLQLVVSVENDPFQTS
jgi:hypothetical protein